MVVSHSDKAGQWAKKNAFDEHRRVLLIIFSACMSMIAILGFLAGLGFRGGWFVAIALFLVVLACLGQWKIIKILDRVLEEGAKRRLQLLRGGQAEAYVSILFRDQLGDQWHLFDNLMLDASSDIDHVLVGPGGLFVISTKSQRGHFKHSNDSAKPTFNDQPTQWAFDAISQAMRLRTLLPHMADDPRAKPPWIQAVLALPFAHIETPDKDPDTNATRSGKCWVLNEDTLTDAIAPEPVPKQRRMSKAEVNRWVEALENLQKRF